MRVKENADKSLIIGIQMKELALSIIRETLM
jgi:hypothetical protein